MSRKARAYIGAVIILGLALAVWGIGQWKCEDPGRFAAYLLLTLMASGLKIRLPGLTATMSVNLVFILIGIVELSLSETLLMGCAGTLLQCVWKTRTRVQPVKLLFNLAVISMAIGAGYFLYRSPLAANLSYNLLLVLPLAASAFFLANTVPVAGVVSLVEVRPLRKVWRDCYFWSFPYYVAGAMLVALMQLANRTVGWQASLVLVPLAYFSYSFYNLYVERWKEERDHGVQLGALQAQTLKQLAFAIRAKDQGTEYHLREVQAQVLKLSEKLGLSEATLDSAEHTMIDVDKPGS